MKMILDLNCMLRSICSAIHGENAVNTLGHHTAHERCFRGDKIESVSGLPTLNWFNEVGHTVVPITNWNDHWSGVSLTGIALRGGPSRDDLVSTETHVSPATKHVCDNAAGAMSRRRRPALGTVLEFKLLNEMNLERAGEMSLGRPVHEPDAAQTTPAIDEQSLGDFGRLIEFRAHGEPIDKRTIDVEYSLVPDGLPDEKPGRPKAEDADVIEIRQLAKDTLGQQDGEETHSRVLVDRRVSTATDETPIAAEHRYSQFLKRNGHKRRRDYAKRLRVWSQRRRPAELTDLTQFESVRFSVGRYDHFAMMLRLLRHGSMGSGSASRLSMRPRFQLERLMT